MIPDKVYNIVINLVPMTILFTIVMASIRLIYVFYAKEKITIYKEIKSLVYIIYTFTLFQLITTTDFNSYSNNFTLFKEILRYDLDSPLFFRNVIGNILLFIPFGYLITDMINEKANKNNIFITGIIILITSLTTEIIQMFIGRSFDIDDIFLNVIGGLLGYIIFVFIHKLIPKLPENLNNNFIKGFVYIAVVIGFFILFYILYTLR